MTDNKWCCPKCGKYYSKNYKYKTHLIRCLVHQEKLEKEYDVMVEVKQELKDELRKTFMDMLDEIKTDLTNKVNQQHQQQPPMKRLINAF